MALAWSVGGAFRKLEATRPGEAPIYLLTEDIEGIGTRAARLGDWVNRAEGRISVLQDNAITQPAAIDPLQYLHYAPNDPLNPGTERVAEIEASLREGRLQFLPTLKISEMPPAFQNAFQEIITDKKTAHPGTVFETSSVDFEEALYASFIVPA